MWIVRGDVNIEIEFIVWSIIIFMLVGDVSNIFENMLLYMDCLI